MILPPSPPQKLQAFESPASHAFSRFVVYVGGLTDGLMACPYVDRLAEACEELSWGLVQPVIGSSYSGYGVGSLARDSADICDLLSFLKRSRGCTSVVLVGHSTGLHTHHILTAQMLGNSVWNVQRSTACQVAPPTIPITSDPS